MKIEVKENKAIIHTPYNPEFVRRIKQVGGARWNGEAWTVDADKVNAVRDIMNDVYGETDICSATEKVSIKLTFTEEVFESRSAVCMFGKVIAAARGRDSGAKIGDDAAFTFGRAKSGGSVKNWQTIIEEGSEVILNNVLPDMIKSENLPDGVMYKVLDTITPSKGALLEEKARLEKRIAEINDLLKK